MARSFGRGPQGKNVREAGRPGHHRTSSTIPTMKRLPVRLLTLLSIFAWHLQGAARQNVGETAAKPDTPISAGEDAGALPAWFSDPVERDRHTTLLARFDKGGKLEDDYSRNANGAS